MDRREYTDAEIIETYRRLKQLQERIEASREPDLDLAKEYRETVFAPGGCITSNLMGLFEISSLSRISRTLDLGEADRFVEFLNERAEEIAEHTNLSVLSELCKDIDKYKRWEASKPFQGALERVLNRRETKECRNYQYAILNFLRLKGMTAKQEGRKEELESCIRRLEELELRQDYEAKRNNDVKSLRSKEPETKGDARDFAVMMNMADGSLLPKRRKLDRSLELIKKLIRKIENGESPQGISPVTYGMLVDKALMAYDQILFLASNELLINPESEAAEVRRDMAELCRQGLDHLEKFSHGQLDSVAKKLEKIGEKELAVQYLERYLAIADEPGYYGDLAPRQRAATLYRLAKLADELSGSDMLYNDTALAAINKAVALNPEATKYKWLKEQLKGKDLSLQKKLEEMAGAGPEGREAALAFLRSYPEENPDKREKVMNAYATYLCKLIRLYVDVEEYADIKEKWGLSEDIAMYDELDRGFETARETPILEYFLRAEEHLLYTSMDKLAQLYAKDNHQEFLTELYEECKISGREGRWLSDFLRKYLFMKDTMGKLGRQFKAFIPLKNLILQCSSDKDCIRLTEHMLKILDACKRPGFVVPAMYEKDLSVRLLDGGSYEDALKYLNRSLRRGFTVEQMMLKTEILRRMGRLTAEDLMAELSASASPGKGDPERTRALLEEAKRYGGISEEKRYVDANREREGSYELLYLCSKWKRPLDNIVRRTSVRAPEIANEVMSIIRALDKTVWTHRAFLDKQRPIAFHKMSGEYRANHFWVLWHTFYLKFDAMAEAVRKSLRSSLEGMSDEELRKMERALPELVEWFAAYAPVEKYDRRRFKQELLDACEALDEEKGTKRYGSLSAMLRESLGLRTGDSGEAAAPRERHHAPSEMGRFFKAINSGSALKRLTHPVDAVENGRTEIEGRMLTAEELWDVLKRQVERIAETNRMPAGLERMLKDYLTGREGWKDARGVAHDSWQRFEREIAAGTFPLNNGPIQKAVAFDALRNSIRLIPDEPTGTNLAAILEEINGKLEGKIAFEGMERIAGLKMFCDVKSLREGLEMILRDIASHIPEGEEQARVEIGYSKNEGAEHGMSLHTLSLTHKGTQVVATQRMIVRKYSSGGGALASIGKKLLNVCDWAVEAEWPDSGKGPTRARRVDFLLDETVESTFRSVDIAPDEFRHILTFYN